MAVENVKAYSNYSFITHSNVIKYYASNQDLSEIQAVISTQYLINIWWNRPRVRQMCLSIPTRLLLDIVSRKNVFFSGWNRYRNPFGWGWILILFYSCVDGLSGLFSSLIFSSSSLRGLKLHPRHERRQRGQDQRYAERNRWPARAVPARTQFKQAAAKLQISGLCFQLLPQICGSLLTVCQSSGRTWMEIIPVTANQRFQTKQEIITHFALMYSSRACCIIVLLLLLLLYILILFSFIVFIYFVK